jgi:hypothetical protein
VDTRNAHRIIPAIHRAFFLINSIIIGLVSHYKGLNIYVHRHLAINRYPKCLLRRPLWTFGKNHLLLIIALNHGRAQKEELKPEKLKPKEGLKTLFYQSMGKRNGTQLSTFVNAFGGELRL